MGIRIRRNAEREVRDQGFEEERGKAVVDRETTSGMNAQRIIDDAEGECSEKGGQMSEENKFQKGGLSAEELEQQTGEQVPDREEMSLVNLNLAAPVNAAVAANVLSDNATAAAGATQDAAIDQGI